MPRPTFLICAANAAAIILHGCGPHPAANVAAPDPASAPKVELIGLTADGQAALGDVPMMARPGQKLNLTVDVFGNRDEFFRYGRQPQEKQAENSRKPLLRLEVLFAFPRSDGKFEPIGQGHASRYDVKWLSETQAQLSKTFAAPSNPEEYELWLSYAHYWMEFQPGQIPFTKPTLLRKVRVTISDK